jgi:hypothetical protein
MLFSYPLLRQFGIRAQNQLFSQTIDDLPQRNKEKKSNRDVLSLRFPHEDSRRFYFVWLMEKEKRRAFLCLVQNEKKLELVSYV